MAESLNRKKGRNTSQYQVLQSHYFNLVLNFESVLPQFTAKCFEKQLISTNDKEESNNKRQPLFDRSKALLDGILKKIEIDSEWYVVLLNILQDFPELEHIRCELNESFLLSTAISIPDTYEAVLITEEGNYFSTYLGSIAIINKGVVKI